MRFVKIFILTVMLFFSYGVMAQSNTTARQVSKEVTINNASAPNIGEDKWKGFLGDTEARVAAGGMGLGAGALTAAGALAMTGVGIPVALGIGAVVGLISAISTYNFSHEAPVCSFNETLGAFYSLNHGSWLSPVFNMLFNAINSLAVAVNGGELADWTIKILALMMAFYLLFTAIKYIVSFSPIEPVKFLSEILFPLGRVIIAVWAIKNWNYIFQNILSPILDLAINFGSEILHVTGRTETYTASVSGGIQPVDAVCTETMKGQGLNVSVCNSIQTFLATISANLLTWMAFGATLIKDCWAKGFGNIFPSFKMLILGILFFIFSFLVYISFPLKLLDTMFRLMFIVILFPLWCVFWVIPQTREYFKKMVNMLINVLATFLSASVVMVMVITILSNLFDSVPLDKIIELLQEDKSEDAMNLIGFSSSGLFYSICLLFMAFHLVGKVEYFANFFAKQDSFGAGAALSGMTTMAITKGVPSAFGIGKNTTKWTAGKIKGGIDRFRAKSYNSRAPGGKDKNGAPARQSPRFWTAAIPGTGLWDAHKAKKQIGGYTRTTEVKTGWLEKAKDGSTSQTYSNKTVDKNGSIKTQMHETTLGNKDKSKQTVDRHVQHFDATGDVRRSAVVKKDFQNGKAVRKTTTMQNKNGGKSNLVVDKAKGIATRTKFGADGKKISETVRDFNTGLTTTTNFGADGNKTTEEVSDKKGLREKTTFGSNGQKVSKYERLANGSKTTSYDANGNVQKTVDDFTQAGQKHHHEADFKNGTRNYTIHDSKGNLLQSQNETRMNDGTVLRQSVDKVKGTESSYVIDRQEGDTLGLHDRVLARTETDSHTGNTTTIRYNPSPDVERTEEVKGRDGSGTTTTYRTNGQTEAVLTDAHGQETARSLTRQDGSKETTRYNRSSDGQVSGFTTIDKDASGKITRHFTVDTQNDTYTDKLTGETAKWSEYRQRS